ncbi:MAG: DegT/DnrJ/EryC1/StrS family aminotransferase [Terriglobia bacterium]|jgi:8-amino-3,8-dideoxy-alpha-D-manno-octulosonate transaminase
MSLDKKQVNEHGWSGLGRRGFLMAAAGTASALFSKSKLAAANGPSPAAPLPAARAGANQEPLALDGGKPVRATRLAANYPGPLYYGDEEKAELIDVIDRRAPFRWYGIGPKGGEPGKCNNFEKELALQQRTRYALAVTSGTMALYTAMAGLGVGPGDEVILPAWTWYSCYNAIVAAGATPVFAEINDSMDIDPEDAERRITPRTKVIMAVHITGEPAEMDSILKIARRHHVKVLEDCAQSAGATYHGKPVGSMGDCGIYSFQECKTITAGEGGAMVTNDPAIFERAARFHDLGQLRKGHQEMLGQSPHFAQLLGGQFRMSEFTGAVLGAQLRKLDRIVADFRDKTDRVTKGLQDLPGIQFRKSNDPAGSVGSAVYFRTASKAQRYHFIRALEAENVPAMKMEGSVILPIVPYVEQKQNPNMDGSWPSFSSPSAKALQYGAACCPRTLEIYDRYVGVQMDPQYSDQDVADIVAAVRKVYSGLIS